MRHGLFQVVGRRQYRGHPTGTRFEARLDAAMQRALDRGDLRLIEEVEPSLKEGTYTLPDDWPPSAADAAHTEAPKGASLIRGGGK